MATIKANKNKDGDVISYRVRACIGRDGYNKQIWRTCTIERPEGLTPKKEEKEVIRLAEAWEEEQKKDYALSGNSEKKVDKNKITFREFVNNNWIKDHVLDGTHSPSSVYFFKYMAEDLIEYFGDKKLRAIDGEAVKRYISYLNNEARTAVYDYPEVSKVSTRKASSGDVTITWPKYKDAISYKVTCNRGKASRYVFKPIGETTELSFVDSQATEGSKYIVKAKVKGEGEPYKKSTIQHHFATLRNIMEYARRFHYIDFDPCQDLSQKEKPHRDKKKVDFLAPKEAVRYMDCLKNEELFWRVFQNVLITTGLRRGEAVGLQWGDIDPEKLTITVQRNVTVDKDSESGYHIGNTKTGESRTVPISERLYKMLMALKADLENKLSEKDDDGNIVTQVSIFPNGFIFNRELDPYTPIYPSTPTRWQSDFVKRHNLPNVSPHDLRHTAATLALESGADLKQVQELLGHKDPSTTMAFYAGVTDEAKRRTVEGIESIING
ncbi:MAG: site-specific integrase [Oscillospiraceae bacterium]|nr:site-specific integrase [Oscillospiraceae bacterium]